MTDVDLADLLVCLKDCAEDLGCEINNRYGGTLDYPSQAVQHRQDMEPVVRARELLTKFAKAAE